MEESYTVMVIQGDNKKWDGVNPFFSKKLTLIVLENEGAFVREWLSLDSLSLYRMATHESLEEIFGLLDIPMDFDEISEIVFHIVHDFEESLVRMYSFSVERIAYDYL